MLKFQTQGYPYVCLVNTSFRTDSLYILEFGYSKPLAGTQIGPRIRECYLMHFILNGSGFFNGQKIEAGNGFLVCPDELNSFSTDPETSWEHCWIGFHGTGAREFLSGCKIPTSNHTFSFRDVERLRSACSRLTQETDPSEISELTLFSFLYYTLSLRCDLPISPNGPYYKKDEYVNQAVTLINKNYAEPFSIASLAEQINISQKYLWRIFTEKQGMPPQKYLLQVRMEAAKKYLRTTNLSVSEIARSVGYSDVISFIQNFKKYTYRTPTEYRKHCE